MSESKKIKTALVSVYHKDGLDAILAKLHAEGVEFLEVSFAAENWKATRSRLLSMKFQRLTWLL